MIIRQITDNIYLIVGDVTGQINTLQEKQIRNFVVLPAGPADPNLKMLLGGGFEVFQAPSCAGEYDYRHERFGRAIEHVISNAIMQRGKPLGIVRLGRDVVSIRFIYDVLRNLSLTKESAQDLLSGVIEAVADRS